MEQDFFWQFYVCECGGEAVSLSAFVLGGKLEDICLSYWGVGKSAYDVGLRARLRHIWHVLKHGHPFLDDVLLSPEKARELGRKLIFLSEM